MCLFPFLTFIVVVIVIISIVIIFWERLTVTKGHVCKQHLNDSGIRSYMLISFLKKRRVYASYREPINK